MNATQQDIAHLDALYQNRNPYHGELHDHSASGGTSDGKRPLSHWRGALEALQMDFATILDHRQVRHMYQPEWEDGMFIGGSEPGTRITDSKATDSALHYNMIFAEPEPLEALLDEFPEFEFSGGPEGHFRYPGFTTERFCQLIDAVKAHGGFFVIPHPKQILISDDPLDYWFRDETGLEVFYNDLRSDFTKANYPLWTALLQMGKRVWVCAGGDYHKCGSDGALTTIYAENRANADYLRHLRKGDFTCGSVGICMSIGDTTMGGLCDFAGQRLVLRTGDFHKSVRVYGHRYRVDLLNDCGLVESAEITCEEPAYFALDAQDCRFYRAEVWDVSEGLRIAIGNPIWNRAYYEA